MGTYLGPSMFRPTAAAIMTVGFLAQPGDARAQEATTVNDGVETVDLSNPAPPGVEWPKALNSHAITAADYPRESIRNREQGTVVVRYVVREDGTVGDIQILRSSGIQRLDDATIPFVTKWRFTPGTRDGKPIRVRQGAGVSWQMR